MEGSAELQLLQLTIVHLVAPVMQLRAIPRLVLVVRGLLPSNSRLVEDVEKNLRVEEWGAIGAFATGATVQAWRPLAVAELFAYRDALGEVGFPDGPCHVEGISDTSDSFSHVELSGIFKGRPFGLQLTQQSSGYRGEQAPALARLLALALGHAQVAVDDPAWRDFRASRES